MKNGFIQKLGGCQRLTSQTFDGICRALMGWTDVTLTDYLAVGTTTVLDVLSDGVLTNVSPIAHTSNLTTPFTTTLGSPTVTVTDATYAPTVGSFINLANAMYVGGLVLQGTYEVLSIGVNTYTIRAASNATAGAIGAGTAIEFFTTNLSTVSTITLGAHVFAPFENIFVGVPTTVHGITFTGGYTVVVTGGPTYSITTDAAANLNGFGFENGGNARIRYLIALPLEAVTAGAFGAGPFGAGPFGVGSAGSAPNILQWSFGRWGQASLVAAYTDGTIYEWTPPVAVGNFAAAVSGAPQQVHGIFVAAPEQQLVAYGVYDVLLGEQDPLLVAWCDVADLNTWTATATNQAGSFRLSSGSRILGGFWFGVSGLLFTDVDLWSMTYIKFPLVYGFNQVANNCGLISQRAFAIMGSTVAWLSQNDFFVYQGGTVQTLECTVRDFIFNNLDRTYAGTIHADANTYFGEIMWRFPTVGSAGVCTGYVKWLVGTKLWDYGSGQPEISAWTDQSPFGAPIGADYNGLLQQFETSNDFDGAVLNSNFQTGFFEIGDGGGTVFLERIIPDFNLNTGGQVQLTVTVADQLPTANSAYPVRTYGPYIVTASTPYIIIGASGRFWQLLVESIAANTSWRYGSPLAIIAPDGR